MKNNLIYVFCMSDSPPEPDRAHGQESLIIGDFYFTIKYVSESEYSEVNLQKNISDLRWLESRVVEHVNVISKIMENGSVIPFKFGTIYNTEVSLNKFCTDYSSSIKENFHYINGKEEWAVKIYCDRKILSEQIDEISRDAADLEEQIMASSPGKAYLLKRKKTDLVDNEMNRICKDHGQSYFDNFKNISESTSLNNLLPKEITGRPDTMILNAAFLVNRNKADLFKNQVDSIKKRSGETGFMIETTGPWPPFSFVSIKEKANG